MQYLANGELLSPVVCTTNRPIRINHAFDNRIFHLHLVAKWSKCLWCSSIKNKWASYLPGLARLMPNAEIKNVLWNTQGKRTPLKCISANIREHGCEWNWEKGIGNKLAENKKFCSFSACRMFSAIDNANMEIKLQRFGRQKNLSQNDVQRFFPFFFCKREQGFNWPHLPSSERQIFRLQMIPVAPGQHQFCASTKLVSETMQEANCHSTRFTFWFVQG